MDNQYENGAAGFEPQRPITEKLPPSPQEEPVNESGGFQPERPLMNGGFDKEGFEDDSFNPIEHTAVYDDNGFVGTYASPVPPAPDASPAPPYMAEPEPPAQQGYYVPQHAAPSYSSPAAQPYAPQSYASPSYAPQPSEPQTKGKVNTALIAVIIALGALLAASLVGLVCYAVFQTKDTQATEKSGNSDSNPFQLIPDFTTPGSDDDSPFIPRATEPAVEHKESDFSDKVDKNYAGLQLEDKPADADENASYNAEYAFKAEADSVVSILCFTDKTDDLSNADSQGSGIVISEDGFVVTNAHLLDNSKTAYAVKVVTADGKEYTAGVVGVDGRTDLAVLKLVDASGLKAATFGDSAKIRLGEDLIVIGNPGGIEYQNSVTKGIVSAINRDASSKNIVKYIQTDAPINPGNSGGPAVNKYGQVVGVASAKIVDEKYEGIGFCIPSAQVKQIVDSLIRNGYVEGRVKIGISGTTFTQSEAESYGIPRGILVKSIDENGPCGHTDLQENDVITELDGKNVTSFAAVYTVLEEHKPGDKVKLKFYRSSDKEEHEIEITLQEDK